MNSEILVFLPTYNERENLPVLLERLFSMPYELSVLIVDDHSPDGTGEVAEELAKQYEGKVRVIHREGDRGRGKAGIVGLSEAAQTSCRLVVEMDADLSHDPEDLPQLLEASENADLVIGSRYMPGGGTEEFGIFRWLNSKTARFLSVLLLGLNYTDPTSGYRVYRRQALEPLPWDKMISPGPSIVEETLYYLKRRGARIIEVPIYYRKRGAGETKITPGIIVRWIMTLLRIRRSAERVLRSS